MFFYIQLLLNEKNNVYLTISTFEHIACVCKKDNNIYFFGQNNYFNNLEVYNQNISNYITPFRNHIPLYSNSQLIKEFDIATLEELNNTYFTINIYSLATTSIYKDALRNHKTNPYSYLYDEFINLLNTKIYALNISEYSHIIFTVLMSPRLVNHNIKDILKKIYNCKYENQCIKECKNGIFYLLYSYSRIGLLETFLEFACDDIKESILSTKKIENEYNFQYYCEQNKLSDLKKTINKSLTTYSVRCK
ncbi:hypothetical protein [Francisella frigiditurris]|uniref:Uncharacterized protein n=1 Tax=Francisella frigiditurris TaxID=1542390 RepID=A0A1J0KTD3_9GAMM|nr:hypothetical protein [Francisella frigiditurris]APC96943.1 hypothetical protein KX01_1432 [Francisella frigiditurris]